MFARPGSASFDTPLRIAVIGSGIAGLSAAWLLSQRHEVSVFEADDRVGGHSHTVDAGDTPVDTGFIVYNEATYPNLTALFEHLDVPTKASDMSLGVSLDNGRLEYSGDNLASLFAQPRNLLRPRFWSMLRDLLRFYREAPAHAPHLGALSLEDYLRRNGYGSAFRDDHLYPMAAAIWSTPAAEIGAYPAASFIRFCVNHGLLQVKDRPAWRTVDGASRAYVQRLTRPFADRIALKRGVRALRRLGAGVEVIDTDGVSAHFDHVVIGAHADQALAMLTDPSPAERSVLGAFGYSRNEAVLHSDTRLMPKRRRVWSSWNYTSVREGGTNHLSVTYWMNKLQGIPEHTPLFVTLNPVRAPDPAKVIRTDSYLHPMFNSAALAAQRQLWSLQGVRNTWFCGAYFGAGFHEDGLQAGLAVAEALGGVRRPWTVPDESGRIVLGPRPGMAQPLDLAS
ncbi:NAD(P)/FAD-dependent oxidoreductase [Azorhizobium sp. AG788]|uniref:NAD(P)/FAD-dependent oxidoreductase n=1 Tax=Azorhizobium sp. AG788 TaxID=2183897 RepID=UPI0031394955